MPKTKNPVSKLPENVSITGIDLELVEVDEARHLIKLPTIPSDTKVCISQQGVHGKQAYSFVTAGVGERTAMEVRYNPPLLGNPFSAGGASQWAHQAHMAPPTFSIEGDLAADASVESQINVSATHVHAGAKIDGSRAMSCTINVQSSAGELKTQRGDITCLHLQSTSSVAIVRLGDLHRITKAEGAQVELGPRSAEKIILPQDKDELETMPALKLTTQ